MSESDRELVRSEGTSSYVGAIQRVVKDAEVAAKVGSFRLRSASSVEARR